MYLNKQREIVQQEHCRVMWQVEALQAQLAEQTKLAKEQVDALMEDRRVKMEEFETRRQRDLDKIQTLTEKSVLRTLLKT